MQQGAFSVFCSALLVLLLSGSGAVVVSAKSRTEDEGGERGDNSYAMAYEKGGAKRYRDIMPDDDSGGRYENSGSESVSGSRRNSSVKESTDSCREVMLYTVKSGDTLFSISRKTGESIDSISEINRIACDRIKPGMKLKIPSYKKKCGGSPVIVKKFRRENSLLQSKDFIWPLRKVNNYRRDGSEDVKSIGIFITGTPNGDVVASMEGVVEKIGYMRGYGRYIAVKHQGRYVTVYSNLLTVNVKEGTHVSRGGVIGSISSDRTLHFQIGHAGKPENPLKHLPDKG